MQNIQKPWRHKIGKHQLGPNAHASGLVEQEAKMGTCDSEVKKHKYQKTIWEDEYLLHNQWNAK